jgi:hypothetical protein
MSEPNPYEPPRELEPLTKRQLFKRGIGVGLILLLTPPATAIATMASCAASRVLDRYSPLILFGIPIGVLTGLVIWAAILDRWRSDRSRRVVSRTAILLTTPVVVLAAVAVGVALDFWVYERVAGWIMLILFFGPPSVALIGMLLWAWRTE